MQPLTLIKIIIIIYFFVAAKMAITRKKQFYLKKICFEIFKKVKKSAAIFLIPSVFENI